MTISRPRSALTLLVAIVAVSTVALVDAPAASTDSTAYLAADLVANQPGIAPIVDPRLINGWGVAASATGGAFWASSEGADVSTLYAGDVGGAPLTKVALEVDVTGGDPTGIVFNTTSDFVITSGPNSHAAVVIFASKTGAVTGWHPVVSPTSTVLGHQADDDAVYTGIALASTSSGSVLYLADFHNGKIDVLDGSFQLVHLAGSFTDPDLPGGYAPFNVAVIGGRLFVAYARRGATEGEPATGPHLGVVDIFDLDGTFEQRLVSRGRLDAPWGMVIAPADFGDFSGALLVGNFGDGRINAFDLATGTFLGTLGERPGRPIEIEGLRGLTFGNGLTAGSATALYYTAGPDHGTNGLFGKITANSAGTSPVTSAVTGGTLLVTGSRGDDRIDVKLARNGTEIRVVADGTEIGAFDLASVSRMHISGWAGDDHIVIGRTVTVPALLDGGAGDDTLVGGGGPSVVLGGPGDDDLTSGDARTVVIGGAGRDRLRGGGADDLLIGGATAYDDEVTALVQILTAWTSTDAYDVRVATLQAGVGGVPKLDSTTVLDDGERDVLRGHAGRDWFFAGPGDALPDRRPDEQLN